MSLLLAKIAQFLVRGSKLNVKISRGLTLIRALRGFQALISLLTKENSKLTLAEIVFRKIYNSLLKELWKPSLWVDIWIRNELQYIIQANVATIKRTLPWQAQSEKHSGQQQASLAHREATPSRRTWKRSCIKTGVRITKGVIHKLTVATQSEKERRGETILKADDSCACRRE